MAGFMTMFKRLNSNVYGMVTGNDFKNGSLPFAYLGKGEKEHKGKLMIYGEKIDDFVFSNEDVASAKILQEEVLFKWLNNKQAKGPKYEVKFKNGKTAIISVPSNSAFLLENIIY